MNPSACYIDSRKLRHGQPPVVLLGGLGQVWPLAMARIAIVLATDDVTEPALASRYLCARLLLPRGDNDAKREALIALARNIERISGKRPPLFCGNDRDLKFVYANRAQLDRHFLLFDNPPDLGVALLNKEAFQALAFAHELPVPRVYGWTDTGKGALTGAPVHAAVTPVLVKPRSKSEWKGSAALHALFPASSKAKVFADGPAVCADPDLMGVRSQVLIQEYIPGGDEGIFSYHGLADEGEVLQWFVGRKLRTFPTYTGESAFVELIRNDEVAALGDSIARRLKLRGVFKMDFKQDARNGKLYLLEINARFNLWHHLGAANGINMPAAVYEYLVNGVRPRQREYSTRYRWQNFGYDLHAYLELHARREISLWHWLRSALQMRRLHDYFSWRDPAPFLRWLANPLLTRIHKWRSTAY